MLGLICFFKGGVLSTQSLNCEITTWADDLFSWPHEKTSRHFLRIFSDQSALCVYRAYPEWYVGEFACEKQLLGVRAAAAGAATVGSKSLAHCVRFAVQKPTEWQHIRN